jgi:hypothetical protein
VAVAEVEVDELLVARGLCREVGEAMGVEDGAGEDDGEGVIEGVKERAGAGKGVTEGETDGVSEGVPCIFNGCTRMKLLVRTRVNASDGKTD